MTSKQIFYFRRRCFLFFFKNIIQSNPIPPLCTQSHQRWTWANPPPHKNINIFHAAINFWCHSPPQNPLPICHSSKFLHHTSGHPLGILCVIRRWREVLNEKDVQNGLRRVVSFAKGCKIPTKIPRKNSSLILQLHPCQLRPIVFPTLWRRIKQKWSANEHHHLRLPFLLHHPPFGLNLRVHQPKHKTLYPRPFWLW